MGVMINGRMFGLRQAPALVEREEREMKKKKLKKILKRIVKYGKAVKAIDWNVDLKTVRLDNGSIIYKPGRETIIVKMES